MQSDSPQGKNGPAPKLMEALDRFIAIAGKIHDLAESRRIPVSEAQIQAGCRELAQSPAGDEAHTAGGRALVRAIYRAMLAAAPSATEAPDGQSR